MPCAVPLPPHAVLCVLCVSAVCLCRAPYRALAFPNASVNSAISNTYPNITAVFHIAYSRFASVWADSRFSMATQPPRTAEKLRANPLGIYVNAINWSRELGQ